MTAELSAALRAAGSFSPKTPYEPAITGAMLDQILESADPAQHPLLAEVARLRDSFIWYTPSFDRIPEPIGSKLSVVELLGPDGLVLCDHCRVGLLLQMPDLVYPAHAHAAHELYLVLSGTAEWQLGDAPFRPQPPGSFIHHPGGRRHAMTTRSEPLLAIWAWIGDIGFGSYRI